MLTQEMVDRDFPALKEWSFLTKVVYHAARGLEVPGANERGVVNWMVCGLAYRDLLKRLEDVEGDGKGIVVLEDDVLIPGMGHTGFDIEGKSYEWRRGYYEALMGCGRASIELEDMIVDTTQEYVFRQQHMIGPSNPKPKRLPAKFQKKAAQPLEENCVRAFAPPETYYMKVLTTKGFGVKEKMDAALAYGNWLDFKGLHDTAEDMYQWALDLATSGLEKPERVLNEKTGVIKPDATVTDNILDATTALAMHRAQSGNPNSALPIFLSILRARREAPVGDLLSQPAERRTRDTQVKRTDLDVLQSQLSAFWSLLQASKFPDPPPSGNNPFVRTPDTSCDEAAIMTYIGEILFATMPSQRDAGLSWTKSAIELAYKSYQDPRTSRDNKIKCVKCLGVGTDNRRKMTELRRSEAASLSKAREHASAWKRWVPGLLTNENALKHEEERWEREHRDLVDFESMLHRGRVFDVQDGPSPIWGTRLLMEWILPRLAGRGYLTQGGGAVR
jgi:hypothetical protein